VKGKIVVPIVVAEVVELAITMKFALLMINAVRLIVRIRHVVVMVVGELVARVAAIMKLVLRTNVAPPLVQKDKSVALMVVGELVEMVVEMENIAQMVSVFVSRVVALVFPVGMMVVAGTVIISA